MASPTSAPLSIRRETELELPEDIDLQVEMANVGSRTLAILIDLAISGLVLLVVYGLILLLARDTTSDWISQLGASAVTTLFLLLIFGFQWGYFNFFEWTWNGQTPGKRLLHLRVIKADGTPVGWSDVFLRNISRPLDTFGPMGLIGLVMIFFSRRAQRPGDIMAGTLVIHETPIDWSIFDEPTSTDAPTQTLAPIRLAPGEWELLHRYLNRREQLDAPTRARLSLSLYGKLKPLTRGTELEISSLAPEPWLAELGRRT